MLKVIDLCKITFKHGCVRNIHAPFIVNFTDYPYGLSMNTATRTPLILLLVPFLLGACQALQPVATEPTTTTSATESSPAPETVQSTKAEPVTQTAATEQPEASTVTPIKRPDIDLNQDILYQLLLAEIAGQRGEIEISLDNYLQLARTTKDIKVVERATRIAVYARDNAAAKESATLWLDLDPESSDAKQILAVMAIREQQLDVAVNYLEDIIDQEQGPFDQKLWMLANMLGREEDQQSVKKVMEQLMASRRDDPDALFAYAHVVTRLGELNQAEELLLEAMRLAPDNENAALTYVSLLQRQEKKKQAVDWLQQQHQKQPDNYNLHLAYARLLADDNRFEEAQAEFEKLDTKHPENIDVLSALGFLHLQANRLEPAKSYFLRLSKFTPKAEEAGYYLGRIHEEQGNLDDAVTWYGGVQQGDHYFDAQIRAASLMAKQGKLFEARNLLQNLNTNSQQERSMLIQAEGELLTDAGMYHEAMQVFDQALTAGYDGDLLYSRAMLAEKMDRLDILEADLKQIIEKEPRNAQALNALGYTLADRTQRYEEAHQYIKQALELNPNDFYILDSMGWVLYRMGRLDEALTFLRKAMDARNDPEIAAHLGEVLWVKGDRDSARDVWETALQQTPEDTRLLDVMKRFIR